MPAFGLVMLEAAVDGFPNVAALVALVWIGGTGFIAWRARSNRVEVRDEALFIEGGLWRKTLTVDFANIENVAETNTRRLQYPFWSGSHELKALRTILFTLLPFGAAVEIELRYPRRRAMPLPPHKWIVFRVERREEFLSTLEAMGVPVRRLGVGVESP